MKKLNMTVSELFLLNHPRNVVAFHGVLVF